VTWKGFKSPSCDVRTNPFTALRSGAAICGFAHSRGGEEALRELLKMMTSIPFPAYALTKAVRDLHQSGLDDVARIVAEYLDKCLEEPKFCATNAVFYEGDRCKNPEIVCFRCHRELIN
jgi:hypothetical protein